MSHLQDALREMEKALDVLVLADSYFSHQASMNAKLHLSDRVIPNPLASAVATEVEGLTRSVNDFRRVVNGEVPLFDWREMLVLDETETESGDTHSD